MSPALKSLAGLRLAISLSTWATPRLAGRLFGLDPLGNPQLPYVGRLFAVRDAALAAGALQSQGRARRDWLAIGAACDAADLAAAILAYRDGQIGPAGVSLLVVAPLAAIGMGVAALREGAAPAGEA